MRCKICDVILSDYEVTRKDPTTGEYLDTCGECLSHIRLALQEFDGEIPYKYDIGLDEDEEI
jgi:hypothetical protein